jgi:hypothetical protein
MIEALMILWGAHAPRVLFVAPRHEGTDLLAFLFGIFHLQSAKAPTAAREARALPPKYLI